MLTLTPTTHTPGEQSRHGSPSPRETVGRHEVRMAEMRIQRIRLLLTEFESMVPRMSSGHYGRLEHALGDALGTLEKQGEVLGRWDRARGLDGTGSGTRTNRRDIVDSAELRSIEDGGNG